MKALGQPSAHTPGQSSTPRAPLPHALQAQADAAREAHSRAQSEASALRLEVEALRQELVGAQQRVRQGNNGVAVASGREAVAQAEAARVRTAR